MFKKDKNSRRKILVTSTYSSNLMYYTVQEWRGMAVKSAKAENYLSGGEGGSGVRTVWITCVGSKIAIPVCPLALYIASLTIIPLPP
jgi:hypothetical protein